MLREKIGNADMFEQAAEECTELAQACLKYSRYIRGVNMPNKSIDEIVDNFEEEIADVKLCLKELKGFWTEKGVQDWATKKQLRVTRKIAPAP